MSRSTGSFLTTGGCGDRFSVSTRFLQIVKSRGLNCEEIIYCYSGILLSLVKIAKANVEIIYSLVLTSFSRKQPVDLLSVNLFVKS